MSVSFMDGGEGSVTAQGVMGSLRCGNPSCNAVLAQVHTLGMGVFRVLDCPSCRRGTEYENTPRGWTVRLLPKRVTPQQVKR